MTVVWEKIDNREWRAKGEKGTWYIQQSGKLFWGRYLSNNGLKEFTMRPTSKLSEAKAACEYNYYWEGEKKPLEPAAKPKPKQEALVPCKPIQQTIPM